jgi:hypothetical protein
MTENRIKFKSEWLFLFNAKWAIFQLYHGENKLYLWGEQVIFIWDDNYDVCLVLDQHAYLDFYSTSSL